MISFIEKEKKKKMLKLLNQKLNSFKKLFQTTEN